MKRVSLCGFFLSIYTHIYILCVVDVAAYLVVPFFTSKKEGPEEEEDEEEGWGGGGKNHPRRG